MASTDATKDATPTVPAVGPTIEQRRAAMHEVTQAGIAKLPPLPESLEEFDINIPVSDGWISRTKIVRPRSHVEAKRPLIVHFFGGAMMVGEPEQLLSPARAFAETYGAVVALPSYRLVPDVRWPVPYKDSWDIMVWLSAHAESELGANLNNGFLVGGASAGAALATVCGGLAMFSDSREAQDAPKLAKPLTGQFLFVPCIAMDEIVPEQYKALFTSREENKNVEGLNGATLTFVMQSLHCPDYTSLWFSPLSAIIEREPVHNIPVYLEHCGLDPLRDDVTVYGKLLQERGVQTKIRLFPDDIHGSWTVVDSPSKASNPTVPEAQMEGMKWLLGWS
jgi:acetyl esterase/lipase